MGKTILVSSHILSELADFCTSIGIIERGKMLAAGSIRDIQQQIRSHRRGSRSASWTIPPIGPPNSSARTNSIRLVETYDHTLSAEFEGQDQDMAAGARSSSIQSGIVVQSFAEEPLSLEGSVHDDHQGNRQLGQLSVVSCQLSVVSCQLSVSGPYDTSRPGHRLTSSHRRGSDRYPLHAIVRCLPNTEN